MYDPLCILTCMYVSSFGCVLAFQLISIVCRCWQNFLVIFSCNLRGFINVSDHYTVCFLVLNTYFQVLPRNDMFAQRRKWLPFPVRHILSFCKTKESPFSYKCVLLSTFVKQ